MILIPTTSTPTTEPFYIQTCTLDGSDYQLEFRYNNRNDSWYLSLYTLSGKDIIKGLKLVTGTMLLARLAADNRPPGDFFVYSVSGQDPTLTTLGEDLDCALCYFEAADFLVPR